MAAELTFLTHSFKGKYYVDYNEEKRGILHAGRRAFQLEVVREMMILVEHSPRVIHEIPFKRGLREVQNKPDIAKDELSIFTLHY